MPIANHVMGKLKKYANTKTISSQIVSSEILAVFWGCWMIHKLFGWLLGNIWWGGDQGVALIAFTLRQIAGPWSTMNQPGQ